MKDIFTSAFLIALLSSGIRQAIPLILASCGDCFSEKAGAIGISLEGEMLFGALFSYIVTLKTGSLTLGLLTGGLAAMLSALIPAIWSVLLKQDQSITGIMFNIFAIGFTNFINRLVFGTNNAAIAINTFKPISIPLLSKIPFIGPVFFNQSILFYLAILICIVVYFLMNKTKLGLLLTAVGENPKAALTCGVNVYRFRILSYLFCGFLAGLAGASLTLGSVGTFTEGVSAGRGFICLAIVILSRWNPLVGLLTSLGFGTIQALQIRLQVIGSSLPYQFFVALPYLITIVVLAFAGTNLSAPKNLGVPFDKEAR